MRHVHQSDRGQLTLFAISCDVCSKTVVAVKYAPDRAAAWSPEQGWREETLVMGGRFPTEQWMTLQFGASTSDPLSQRPDVWLCSRECASAWGEAEYDRQA